jgi:hypothetical protein
MPVPEPKSDPEPSSSSSGALGAAARLYWMLAGNAALGLLAALIAKTSAALSWLDLAYWAVFASLIAVRYADVALLGGSSADGVPATRTHWRRYSVVLSLICVAVWVAARAAALLIGGGP